MFRLLSHKILKEDYFVLSFENRNIIKFMLFSNALNAIFWLHMHVYTIKIFILHIQLRGFIFKDFILSFNHTASQNLHFYMQALYSNINYKNSRSIIKNNIFRYY